MVKTILEISDRVKKQLASVESIEALSDLRTQIFGRKGEITELLRTISGLSIDEKRDFGKKANELKIQLQNDFLLRSKEIIGEHKTEIDITEPGADFLKGHLHPITKVQEKVEDIFIAMGFSVYEGPELDSEYFNFDALNIPNSHPARDMQDTFFVGGQDLVMRTHTSNTQNRVYKKFKPPFQVIIPGRCFRNEATDASHDLTFHQVEGVVVGEKISLANLKAVMKEFLSTLFKKEVKIRFRPGYFPFVEPGLELDFSCLLCDGKGCSVCKKTGWVEFMGCGMIHENVLTEGGIDTQKYNGFAFGFGLTRLVMMRYGIEDIRHFHSGDLRFNYQF